MFGWGSLATAPVISLVDSFSSGKNVSRPREEEAMFWVAGREEEAMLWLLSVSEMGWLQSVYRVLPVYLSQPTKSFSEVSDWFDFHMFSQPPPSFI